MFRQRKRRDMRSPPCSTDGVSKGKTPGFSSKDKGSRGPSRKHKARRSSSGALRPSSPLLFIAGRSRSLSGTKRVSTPPPMLVSSPSGLSPRTAVGPIAIPSRRSPSAKPTSFFRGELSSARRSTLLAPRLVSRRVHTPKTRISSSKRAQRPPLAVRPVRSDAGQSSSAKPTAATTSSETTSATDGKSIVVSRHLSTRGEADLSGRSMSDATGASLVQGLSLARVQSLLLYSNQLGDLTALQIGAGLALNKSLTVLLLSHNLIGDRGAELLAEGLASNDTLECLSVDYNRIGDAGAARLALALGRNRTLRTLDLDGNRIGDAGAQSFADALRCASVRELSLADNVMGKVGLEALCCALPQGKSVRRMAVDGNPGYSSALDQAIKLQLRHARKAQRKKRQRARRTDDAKTKQQSITAKTPAAQGPRESPSNIC